MLTPKAEREGPKRYYYDLQTGEMFVAEASELPPIVAPSGGEAVVALAYTCNDCGNESERFVLFYEKYSEAYKQALAQQATAGQLVPEAVEFQGHLIRTPDDERWVPMQSEQGVALWDTAIGRQCQDGGRLQACAP